MKRSRTIAIAIYLLTFIGMIAFTSELRAQIVEIQVGTETANINGAGTDASIYLGIGGREFNLDNPSRNNFERNQEDAFVFGDRSISNVVFPEGNNPRDPQLTMDDVDRFPVYIRMSDVGNHSRPFNFPADEWIVDYVRVSVIGPFGAEKVFTSPLLGGIGDQITLRLSSRSGFLCSSAVRHRSKLRSLRVWSPH
jgi:hypothetical protein